MITLSNKSIIKGFLKENILNLSLAVGILTSAVFLDVFYIQANPHIEGKWTTGCNTTTFDTSVIETIHITKDLLTVQAMSYSDKECKKPMTVARSAMLINFLHTDVLETTIERGSFEVLDSAIIPTLNAMKAYDVTDWKIATSYDVTGKNDNFWGVASNPSIGSKQTVRVLLTDSVLAFTKLDSTKSSKPPLKKDTDAK